MSVISFGKTGNKETDMNIDDYREVTTLLSEIVISVAKKYNPVTIQTALGVIYSEVKYATSDTYGKNVSLDIERFVTSHVEIAAKAMEKDMAEKDNVEN